MWSRLLLGAVVASCQSATLESLVPTDPHCPVPFCCGAGGAGDECAYSSLWTRAYCCPEGSGAECYRWGEDAPGHDLVVGRAVSAVECRHLCQAHESCAYWTYFVDAPGLASARGRCMLKDQRALQGRLRGRAFVVSGERLCSAFAEGLPASAALARNGYRRSVWRTAAAQLVAGAAQGAPLLDSAGSGSWHLEAAAAFSVLGFVAVLGALSQEAVQELRSAAQQVAESMLARDPTRLGNRGPRRYSYGGASPLMHMMHVRPWPKLLDNHLVDKLLRTIFPDGYVAAGGGGDFVLGGTDTYQSLHIDLGTAPFYHFDRPPAVAVNFVLEDLSCAGGPLRVLPGSHRREGPLPTLFEEPQEAKDMVLCPLPAGTAIFRDLRTWHGGTPNALATTRYLPNAEFVSAEWTPQTCGKGGYLDPCSPVLPLSAYTGLSERGRAIAAGIVDESGGLQEVDATSSDWILPDFARVSRQREEAY